MSIYINHSTNDISTNASASPTLGGINPFSKISGDVVQIVNTQTGAVATGTTTLPVDDTIPQRTEGDQYMTLSITPTSATNKLKIEVIANLSSSNTDTVIVGALFQDTAANALAAAYGARGGGLNARGVVNFTHYMTAGTTSSTTFTFRAGTLSAGTTTFNGISGGREFGGVLASSITITEIKV